MVISSFGSNFRSLSGVSIIGCLSNIVDLLAKNDWNETDCLVRNECGNLEGFIVVGDESKRWIENISQIFCWDLKYASFGLWKLAKFDSIYVIDAVDISGTICTSRVPMTEARLETGTTGNFCFVPSQLFGFWVNFVTTILNFHSCTFQRSYWILFSPTRSRCRRRANQTRRFRTFYSQWTTISKWDLLRLD